MDLGGAAGALEGLIDQHAQDLVLGLARHVGDLVDEQRAAMGLFQRAGLALLLAVRSASMPNSSTSIRSGVIAAALMTTNGPSDAADAWCSVRAASSLPRTGRADDQDAAVGLGGAVDGLAQLIHAGRAAGQNASCRSQLLQFLHLALEPRGLQRAGRDQDQPVGLERLFDEVIGAALDRSDGGFDVAVAGDHHHRQIGIVLLDLLQQLQAVELGALQPDVEEHQMRAAIGNLRQRRIAVARGAGAETFVVQNARNEIANIGFVVDDQNVTCHGLHLPCQSPVAAWIFVSLLVVAAGSMVSGAGAFVSAVGSVASA